MGDQFEIGSVEELVDGLLAVVACGVGRPSGQLRHGGDDIGSGGKPEGVWASAGPVDEVAVPAVSSSLIASTDATRPYKDEPPSQAQNPSAMSKAE